MLAVGLRPPQTAPSALSTSTPAPAAPPTTTMAVGGVVQAQSLGAVLAENARALDAQFAAQQAQPVIAGLAGHIKRAWSAAQTAKQAVEQEMLEALYARRGQYPAEKLAAIKESGQPVIYMMLASVKMRQAESLLRDVFTGQGNDKPWTLSPPALPELPPLEVNQIRQALAQELEEAILAGLNPTTEDVRQRMMAAKAELQERTAELARAHTERMELKMEDQLDEGGFPEALDQFITDLTTFKTAFISGPIVRKKPKLGWSPAGVMQVTEALCLEWERVSPFDMYPAAWAKSVNDGPLIRKHKLTREKLNEMRGVEGYSEPAIVKVLDLYGSGGLNEWLSIDSQLAVAEGKNTSDATQGTDLIDALQYWGSVSGKMLQEWGLKPAEVPDAAKEYQVEAWLIGPHVIKAVLNADPLARRPYYADSYDRVPGSVWGNCPYDLMRDCQDMCNAAARAMAANLGISSGPQVVVNTDRIAPGQNITSMFPWKIWQTTSDPMGSTALPITFFQPGSNAAELMGVYEKFSQLADEYTGIPRYMTGTEGTPGAGRTASGLSMMIGNASKIIKQVVYGIDVNIFTPMLERLYYYNMRYANDPELKGDVAVVARGALSLQVRDTAQVRRNEFLQSTANPIDMQIIGLEGRAEVLRSAAQTLDLNTDRVVPPVAILKERAKQQQMQAQQMLAMQTMQQQGGQGGPSQSGQQLMNGAPTTDNFSPARQG